MKKYIIFISTIFFIALTALWAFVQSETFSIMLRERFGGTVSEILGPDVKFGRIKANLIPLYLEVRDVSVSNGSDGEALAVHKARMYLNPFPLIYKNISLPLIVIVDPRISTARLEGGELDVSATARRLKDRAAKHLLKGPSSYEVVIRTVTIKNGSMRFSDRPSSADISVSGLFANAKVNLSIESAKVNVKKAGIHIAIPAHPAMDLSLRASTAYRNGSFIIDSLDLFSRGASLSVSGRLGALPSSDLDLRLRCRLGQESIGRFAKIFQPVKSRQAGNYIEGLVDIRGKISDPDVNGAFRAVDLALRGVTVRDAAFSFTYKNKIIEASGSNWRLSRANRQLMAQSVRASAEYRQAGLDIRELVIATEDAEASLKGRVDVRKGFESSITIESFGAGRTIAFIASFPIEGTVKMTGSVSGSLGSPAFEGEVFAGPATVKGTVFHDVKGKVVFRDGVLALTGADIYQRSSRFIMNGSVDMRGETPLYDAGLRAVHADVAPIVAIFYSQLPLDITASGDLFFNGTATEFAGRASLLLGPGSAYGETFDGGLLSVSLTPEKITFPQILLRKGSGAVRGEGWIEFDGDYYADITSRNIDLSEVKYLSGLPVSGNFMLGIESSGSFFVPSVEASLEVPLFSFRKVGLGELTLEAEITNKTLTFKSALTRARASVMGNMLLKQPYPWSAHSALNSETIDLLSILGMEELSSRAAIALEGSLSLTGEGFNFAKVSGNASLRRFGIAIEDYRIENEHDVSLEIKSGKFLVKSLRFTGPGTQISISGGAEIKKDMDFSLTGNANLSLLRLLYKEVEYGEGEAEMSLAVKGAWGNPDITGGLRVKKGEVKIKDIPQKFVAIDGKIGFDKERIISDSLTAEIGGGSLSVAGRAQLDGLSLEDFSVNTAIENVTVRYPEGLLSTLSGDLSYYGNSTEQTLSGEVAIKKGRYDKRIEWKSMLVDITKGFYQKRKTNIGWIGDTRLNVRFHGKEGVILQNNLGKVPIDLDVIVGGTVSQPQLLGRLEARKGVVYFRRNDFKILSASVDFIDPNRMNPLLDVQAETRVREFMVRLAVSGDADHAAITFMSNPPLSDVDILSLLALGKTSTELTGKETGVGMSEAASLATGQFQDMFERRARSLTGLDRFQIDPYVSKAGDTSVPRITVGKELVKDRLFVTYSSNVGAAVPEQIFRIEYVLDRSFSLVGERNEIGSIGADLKYRIEFK